VFLSGFTAQILSARFPILTHSDHDSAVHTGLTCTVVNWHCQTEYVLRTWQSLSKSRSF